MPKAIDKCVKTLMADPDFKPKKKGDSKKDAAWAVCTARHKEGNLTEESFDNDMKILFSDLKTYLKFDEEVTGVGEQVNQNKAYLILDEHIWALRDTVSKVLIDDEVKEKSDKVLARIEEFAKLAKAEIKKLGDFTERRGEIIPFTAKIEPYEIVEMGDKVKINNLPIFILGNWREYLYNENWANNIAIAGFNENKSTGHLPAICIQHTYDKDGHPEPKAVKGFFDNLRLKDDVIYCDTLPIDKQMAKDFPFRSVEINPNTRRIDAVAIHGAESVPFFKFPPVMFEEGKDTGEKIIITFVDENFKSSEGGEEMDDKKKISEEEKKNFIQGILGAVEKFFEKKGEAPKVELFTEEDVKEREKKAVETAQKEVQTRFMDDQKEKEIGIMLKDLFGENGRKEGLVLAPRLKNRVEAFLKSVSNQSTIKFTEEVGAGDAKKPTEKELTQFKAVTELLAEILREPKTALVELGEKSTYIEVPNPSDKDSFTEKQANDLGTKVAQKYGAKKKEEKK